MLHYQLAAKLNLLELLEVMKMVLTSSNREHTTKQIPTAWDFFVRVRGGSIFSLAKENAEPGSRKFCFDENKIICDHKLEW